MYALPVFVWLFVLLGVFVFYLGVVVLNLGVFVFAFGCIWVYLYLHLVVFGCICTFLAAITPPQILLA